MCVEELTRPFNATDVSLTQQAMVEASAGTGKTYALSILYLRYIVELGVPIHNIVVVSFTKDASYELQMRIRQRLEHFSTLLDRYHAALINGLDGQYDATDANAAAQRTQCIEQLTDDVTDRALLQHIEDLPLAINRLIKALAYYDDNQISTIHGFCTQLLNRHALQFGVNPSFTVEDNVDKHLQVIIRHFWQHHFAEDSIRHSLWLNFYADYTEEKALKRLKRLVLAEDDAIEWWPDNETANEPVSRLLSDDGVNVKVKALAKHGAITLKHLLKTWHNEGEQALAEIERAVTEKRLHASVKWAQQVNGLRAAMVNINSITLLPEADELSPNQWMELINQMGHFYQQSPGFKYLMQPALESKVKRDHAVPQHPLFQRLQQGLEATQALQDLAQSVHLQLEQQLLLCLREQRLERLGELNVLGNDDLLKRVADGIADSPELLQRIQADCQVGLIDEFQDSDAVQYDIFQRIFQQGGAHLFYVGDPKQAIYSFRGGDIFTYIKARNDLNNTYGMDTNWRSHTHYIAAMNALFSMHSSPFMHPDIHYQTVNAVRDDSGFVYEDEFGNQRRSLDIHRFEYEGLDAQSLLHISCEWVSAEIAALLKAASEGRASINGATINASDIAVLVNKNKEALAVQKALSNVGIHAVISQKTSVFETEEAQSLLMIMHSLGQAHDQASLRFALATPLLRFSWPDIQALEADDARYGQLLSRWQQWQKLAEKQGYVALMRSIMEYFDCYHYVPYEANTNRRITNMLHLAELCQQHYESSHVDVSGMAHWLSAQISHATDASQPPEDDSDQIIRVDNDDDMLTITTVFKSKGLEYPIVYTPFIAQRSSSGQGGEPSWPVVYHPSAPAYERRLAMHNGDAVKAAAKHERLQENMRLFYVAMTRAAYSTQVFEPVKGLKKGSANINQALLAMQEERSFSDLSSQHIAVHACQLESITERVQRACVQTQNKHRRPLTALPAWIKPAPMLNIQGIQHWSYSQLMRWRQHSFTDAPTMSVERAALLDPVAEGEAGAELYIEQVHAFANSANASMIDSGMVDSAMPVDVVADHSETIEFPSGAQAGLCLHSVLEGLDYSQHNYESLHALISERLYAFGYDQHTATYTAAALRLVQQTMESPLPSMDGAFTLAEVPHQQRIDEMGFQLNFAEGLRWADVVDVMAEHWQEFPLYDAADKTEKQALIRHLQSINVGQLKGVLHGYIDVTLKHQGRYYVLDYKSNHLASQYGDYAAEAINESMRTHHYMVQYLLYSVAVHRYLSYRLKHYNYAEHFGGVLYLFIRGLDASKTAKQQSVYSHRPSKALVEALSQCFQAADGESDELEAEPLNVNESGQGRLI